MVESAACWTIVFFLEIVRWKRQLWRWNAYFIPGLRKLKTSECICWFAWRCLRQPAVKFFRLGDATSVNFYLTFGYICLKNSWVGILNMTGVVPFESPNLEQNSHLWISAFPWKSANGCFLTQRQAGFVTRLLVGRTQLASWDNWSMSTALQSNSQGSQNSPWCSHSKWYPLCSPSGPIVFFFYYIIISRCVPKKERWEHQNDLVNETWFFSLEKNTFVFWAQCLWVNYLRQSQVMGAQVFMTPFLAAIYVVNPGERKHTETRLMVQKSG